MGNMSYCRFQNTLGDLRDCLEAIEEGDADDEKLSAEEKRAKVRLIATCRAILEATGEDED